MGLVIRRPRWPNKVSGVLSCRLANKFYLTERRSFGARPGLMISWGSELAVSRWHKIGPANDAIAEHWSDRFENLDC
jgi:hypothetical protein